MKKPFPFFSVIMAVLGVLAITYLYVSKDNPKNVATETTTIPASPIKSPNVDKQADKRSPSPTQTIEVIRPTVTPPEPSATPEPAPTPPPLDESDPHLLDSLKALSQGQELIKLLAKDEIVRKTVRAVYGLSEGRIVRQYRPLNSPKTQMLVNKIGRQKPDTMQEIYRISRENSSRYTQYVSLFSKLNNKLSLQLYYFYSPVLEQAYRELGLKGGTFHTTLIKAIDVLLNAPTSEKAILLTRPSVMYKFDDPELEKLPQAHKLMLRMGQENSETLKLELKSLRLRLQDKR